ncbi:MAG: hypothetical protein WDZ94_04215 [Patescibacteria group bacterium]
MATDFHIFHGENTVQSRSDWLQIKELFESKGFTASQHNAKQLDLAQLEQLLSAQSLFGDQRVITIEGLLSLPQSKKKKQLVSYLAEQLELDVAILLWEPKLITAAGLKPFKKAQVHTHKAAKQIFSWLDSLGQTKSAQMQQQLSQLTAQESAIFIHTMLARQLRMLIAAKDGGTVTGAPFMIKKLQAQAQRFQLRQLLAAHQSVLEIEYRQKQGITRLTWEQELDLWLISL